MTTQSPILKRRPVINPAPVHALGSPDLDTIKLLSAAVVLAVVACMMAVAIATAVCRISVPGLY